MFSKKKNDRQKYFDAVVMPLLRDDILSAAKAYMAYDERTGISMAIAEVKNIHSKLKDLEENDDD